MLCIAILWWKVDPIFIARHWENVHARMSQKTDYLSRLALSSEGKGNKSLVVCQKPVGLERDSHNIVLWPSGQKALRYYSKVCREIS